MYLISFFNVCSTFSGWPILDVTVYEVKH